MHIIMPLKFRCVPGSDFTNTASAGGTRGRESDSLGRDSVSGNIFVAMLLKAKQ